MRSLTGTPSEAAGFVLHRAGGTGQLLPKIGDIVTQDVEGIQDPVEKPRPACVGGEEPRGKTAERTSQKADVALPVERRDSMDVVLELFVVAREEGQTDVDRLVLDLGGGCGEVILHQGVPGEEVGNHEVRVSDALGDEFLVDFALRFGGPGSGCRSGGGGVGRHFEGLGLEDCAGSALGGLYSRGHESGVSKTADNRSASFCVLILLFLPSLDLDFCRFVFVLAAEGGDESAPCPFAALRRLPHLPPRSEGYHIVG